MKSEGVLLNLFIPRTRGACLAHFRSILQVTQTEISKEIGINRSSISKMENGDINVSESVWSLILYWVYQAYDLGQSITFDDFRSLIEQFIEEDSEGDRGQQGWLERKLSWEPVTSI